MAMAMLLMMMVMVMVMVMVLLMMMVMVNAQENLGVSRISLSVTTMDDVFLKIGEMVEAQVRFVT